MREPSAHGGCLDDATLDRFRAGRLSAMERGAAEAHLADCADCRGRLIEAVRRVSAPERVEPPGRLRARVRGFGRPGGGGRAPRSGVAGARWLGLAALLLLGLGALLWTRPARPPAPADGSELRSGADATPRLLPLSPPDGARIGEGGVELRWSVVPGARSYRVRILDTHGEILLERRVGDAALAVAPGALPAGGTLYWTVRAELPEGVSFDSEPARLIAAPAEEGRE